MDGEAVVWALAEAEGCAPVVMAARLLHAGTAGRALVLSRFIASRISRTDKEFVARPERKRARRATPVL